MAAVCGVRVVCLVAGGSFLIDPQVLTQLWRAHAERLLLIARAIGEPAEDAVQEAFVSLACQPVVPDQPLAWLVRTTRNQLLQWRRSQGRRSAREQQVCSAQDWFLSPQEVVERRLDSQQVTAWLIELEDDQREVIVMHLWGELSFREIAKVTGYSVAKANRVYHFGLGQLRAKAEQSSKRVMS